MMIMIMMTAFTVMIKMIMMMMIIFFFARTLASLLDGKVKLSQSMGVLYYCLVT